VARLSWGNPGERYYEDGVDRGVLYVDDIGYVWNGLISVSEKPSGGEHRSYYLDGIKYLSLASAEEYEATISAISSPPEFAACDGVKTLYQGLFVTQQKRKPFGFSYRTMINDDMTPDSGYKIHLVYNALAAPSERNNKSRSDSPALEPLTWFVQAVPPVATGLGFKPTAHFVIDSRIAPEGILTDLENILYGSEAADARFPTQLEILNLFEVYATVQVDDNGDGTATITAPDNILVVDPTDPTEYTITWGSVVSTGVDTVSISSL
jgi:hypothetical protein